VFIVVREEARSTVAMIHDFIASGLQLLSKSGCTQCRRAFSLPMENAAALEGAPIKAISSADGRS